MSPLRKAADGAKSNFREGARVTEAGHFIAGEGETDVGFESE